MNVSWRSISCLINDLDIRGAKGTVINAGILHCAVEILRCGISFAQHFVVGAVAECLFVRAASHRGAIDIENIVPLVSYVTATKVHVPAGTVLAEDPMLTWPCFRSSRSFAELSRNS